MNGFVPGEAPLCEALIERAGKGAARFHMPGHKGKPLAGFLFPEAARLDFTELSDTGDLYRGGGPIARAEALAARACGAETCLFLTGGATQGILSSIAYLCPPGSKLLMSRASHLSVYHAAALLGLRPVYLYPSYSARVGVPGGISPAALERALAENPDARAVALTSPTYYGALLDVGGLAEICARSGVPLVVDGAHGAHLPFLGRESAVGRGALLEINSPHKTLPALGQGAWILAGPGADADALRRMTAAFGTSSPSYAIMASLDASRAWMQGRGGADYQSALRRLGEIKDGVRRRGVFSVPELSDFPDCAGLDPGRLCLHTARAGMTGFRAAELLESRFNVACEMADGNNAVFIVTCADGEADLARLDGAVRSLETLAPGGPPLPAAPPLPPPGDRALLPGEAFFSKKRRVRLADSAGLVCAECVAPYPPGVPVIAPGERIRELHLAYLLELSYNISEKVLVTDRSV